MSSPRLILVADDDEDVRIIARTILVDRGFVVDEAMDGGEAVRLARRSRPDLIVMDLMMPGVDGLEAIEMLKADPELRSIPVVALTSSDPPKAEIRAAGFCALLRKPVKPPALARAVEVCLEEHEAGKRWVRDLVDRIARSG